MSDSHRSRKITRSPGNTSSERSVSRSGITT
jgi:hypothetical protein